MLHNEGSAGDDLVSFLKKQLESSICLSIDQLFFSGFGHHTFYFSTFLQRNTEVEEAVKVHMTIG